MSQLDTLREQSARLDYLPDGMNWRKFWDPLVQYVKNDVVRSPLNTATYVANYNSLGGLDPSQSPAGQPWTKLGKGEAESLIASSVGIGSKSTTGVVVPFQNGVVFNKVMNIGASPALFNLPTNVRNGSNTILMIVSGIVLDHTNFSDIAMAVAAGPYQVGGSVAAPASYPDGQNPLGTYNAGAIVNPATQCLPTQIKFYSADAGYFYTKVYPYPPSPPFPPDQTPTGPPVPNGFDILYPSIGFVDAILYSASHSLTMTFVLQKGVDFTDATTQMGIGYATISGDGVLQVLSGVGLTADFVGL